jgi:glyoxylase-like metal-dependent hydrolase (beta-lactamase superfamily II)
MRQAFACLLLVLAALQSSSASGLPGASRPIGLHFDVQEVAPGVYAVIRKDPPGLMVDGNSAFIVNEDDVVVVDAPESSPEVLAALRRITSKPVRYVVNTHWHDDHITGNAVYRKAFPGVEIVAHESFFDYLPAEGRTNRQKMIEGAGPAVARIRRLLSEGRSFSGEPLTNEERASYESDVRLVDQYLARVPKTEYLLPTVAVRDRLTLRRGKRTIEILHLGRGHTSGDLVVFLPDERVLIAGDLVIWPVPLVGSEQSHVGDWSASLEKARALGAALVVPGHGPVLRDQAYLRLMADSFASIRAQAEAAVAQGQSLEDFRRSVDLAAARKGFAGDSRVRQFLFETYVAGPAVASAFRDASGTVKSPTPPPS